MVAKRMAVLVVLLCFVCVSFAQDKRVYLGLRAGAGFGLSSNKDEKKDLKDIKEPEMAWKSGGGSFDIAPFVSFQLADKFALGTEFLFTKYGYGGMKIKEDFSFEGIPIAKKGDSEYETRSALVIPVLAQLTFAERKVKIFAGPHFSANLGTAEYTVKLNGNKTSVKATKTEQEEDDKYYKNPLIGLTGGASFGFNAGPGNLFFDIRYLTDLGKPKYKNDDDKWVKVEKYALRRAKLGLSVGYEFGAGSR